MRVHPIAELFPMMSDEELQDLADDIKEYGLAQPIIIGRWSDGDEVIEGIIDGRNRFKACGIAGIEPQFEQYDGDPVPFIWSLNDRRRHMTKGQRAMVAAMADPEGHQGKANIVDSSTKSGVSRDYLSRARLVLRYAPDLAPLVRDGNGMTLDKAYESAKLIKQTMESAEAVTARLQKEAPQLAKLVSEGELLLPAALAALDEQQRQAKLQRANLFEHLAKAVYLSETIGSEANIEHAAQTLVSFSGEFEGQQRYSVDRLIQAIDQLPKQLKDFARKLKQEERRWQATRAEVREAAE